jgi:hypothetical protein
MKCVFKKVFVALTLCLCVLSFVSCKNAIKGDEAKELIKDFFATVVDEDYEGAEALLHPDRPADLEDFLLNVEKQEDIDFQEGIEIEKYTSFSSSLYDSTVDGARYELTLRAKVGDKTVIFTIEIVRNESGYGIYNFDLDI